MDADCFRVPFVWFAFAVIFLRQPPNTRTTRTITNEIPDAHSPLHDPNRRLSIFLSNKRDIDGSVRGDGGRVARSVDRALRFERGIGRSTREYLNSIVRTGCDYRSRCSIVE